MFPLHGLPYLAWGECRVVAAVQSDDISVDCSLSCVPTQCCLSPVICEFGLQMVEEFPGISSASDVAVE